MDGTRFRLDLNLQKQSMVTIAEKLWDAPDIKSRIRNVFSDPRSNFLKRLTQIISNDSKNHSKNWCVISKLVVQYGDSIGLPPSVAVKLKKIIVVIGQTIYNWILYVTEELQLDFLFTERIYWTSYGAVDEGKIFDLYWKKIMSVQGLIIYSKSFKHTPVFALGCMYARERFINEHKDEMLNELSKFYPSIRTGDDLYNIMAVSICLTANKRLSEFVPKPRNMLELCLYQGFGYAANFFWERLDENEKVSNLSHFAYRCLTKENKRNSFFYCESFLYLINQMELEEKCTFMENHADRIIFMFLPLWPYHELVKYLLQLKWNIDSERSLNLAQFVLELTNRFVDFEYPVEREMHFQIFKKAWVNISMYQKMTFLQSHNVTLFSTLDVPILNLVFNDPDIPDEFRYNYRKDAVGLKKFVQLGHFHFIDEVIEKVFNSDPKVKEYLKESFRIFGKELLEDDKFDFVDEFLDWISETEEDRARIKNKINTCSICTNLTAQLLNFELAEKFLNWRFETDAEIRSFKDGMKFHNFVRTKDDGYIRIVSGDLSEFKPGDSLVLLSQDDTVSGFTYMNYKDTIELVPGVAVGRKSSTTSDISDFQQPNETIVRVSSSPVVYVGTKPGDYVAHHVYQIWRKREHINKSNSFEKLVYLSDAFIKFYYETDEEVEEFKKTKLQQVLDNQNVVEFLFCNFFKDLPYVQSSILDAFFKFSLIPSKKVEEVKIRLRNDIEKLMDDYLINKFDLDLADFCINWLYCASEKDKKLEAIKTVLNSSNKGALLCVSYLTQEEKNRMSSKNMKEYDPASLAFRIGRWLSMIDVMEKLKKDLVALKPNQPEWFLFFLDELSRGDVMCAVAALKRQFFY